MAASAKTQKGQKRTDSRKHERGHGSEERLRGNEKGETDQRSTRTNRAMPGKR